MEILWGSQICILFGCIAVRDATGPEGRYKYIDSFLSSDRLSKVKGDEEQRKNWKTLLTLFWDTSLYALIIVRPYCISKCPKQKKYVKIEFYITLRDWMCCTRNDSVRGAFLPCPSWDTISVELLVSVSFLRSVCSKVLDLGLCGKCVTERNCTHFKMLAGRGGSCWV